MIVIVGASIFLYITTDFLKSSEVLFQKYIAQNFSNITEVIDISTEEQNIDLLNKSDYTEATQMSLGYLESANDEEEIYDIKEQGIIKNSENTSYRKITANYGEQELLNIDLLAQNNMFGLRLANLVQQFVSVENANISYFISSMGYEGQYFSETLNKVDIAGLLVFSEEEIETLATTYSNILFADISSDHYSANRNAMITLNNGQSVTTNAYSLTLTKNELDNICKRLVTQATSDQIILNKLEQLDTKIQEIGINEEAGISLKEMYLTKLQEFSNNLNYEGIDTRQIVFTVYQAEGVTVRTSIRTEETEINLDLDKTNGTTLSLKIEKLTAEGTDTKIYALGKGTTENETQRTVTYTDGTQNLNISINTVQQQSQIIATIHFNYASDQIASISGEATTDIILGTNETIPVNFDETNNILLNQYDGTRILSILDNLKNRAITSLENSQSVINTKLLNNIIVMIDEREQRLAEEEQNNRELQRQRFNNQFILYEGQEVEYEYIQKLLQTASRNMSDYQVISGNQIRLLIEEGTENEAKANEIANAISERYTYDVVINYSDDRYVESIDIYVHQE